MSLVAAYVAAAGCASTTPWPDTVVPVGEMRMAAPVRMWARGKPGSPPSGSLQLRAAVNTDGVVQRVEVVQGSGDARLDADAVQAWRAARFVPYRRGGQVLPVTVAIPVDVKP